MSYKIGHQVRVDIRDGREIADGIIESVVPANDEIPVDVFVVRLNKPARNWDGEQTSVYNACESELTLINEQVSDSFATNPANNYVEPMNQHDAGGEA